MIEIKCPDVYGGPDEEFTVFVGGGITGCPDWQADIAEMLKKSHGYLLNPRRDEFDVTNLSLSKEQIKWEHSHLRVANAVLFWFPCETLCPITLFELGVWSEKKGTKLFVGCHPEYKRKLDVEEQLMLSRPDIEVVDSLEALVDQVAHASYLWNYCYDGCLEEEIDQDILDGLRMIPTLKELWDDYKSRQPDTPNN